MLVKLPGLNHLLVPATTGERDEYGKLPDRNVSPDATAAIGGWLKDALKGKLGCGRSRRRATATRR